jgi:tetratricopeptide (TPR) repeat protein
MRLLNGLLATRCRSRAGALLMLLAWCVLLPAHADPAPETRPGIARVLGEIEFPTSTRNAGAQQAFIRGMLLLHLFEYPHAREEFLRAQQLAPDFAMAYWGEAMTHNHPIWDEQNREAGQAALLKLGATPGQRHDATDDPREQAFLASLDLLYGDSTKAARDRAYLRALEQMAGRYPDDHEVQLFYALALLGVHAGVRETTGYMLSTAISQAVFCQNPKHPGAAHYLIHGVDDPEHAVLGLAAARALAAMAPDAGHSLHMTSHIFTALGMWDEVVTANQNAVRVQNAMRVEQGEQARRWGHYSFWLLYGYLQQGRFDAARELLTDAYRELQQENRAPEDRMILDPDRSQAGSVVQMWLRYLVETRDWNGDIAGWNFKLGDAFDPNLNFSYAQALRAANAGQASQVREYLDQFSRLKEELGRMIRYQGEPPPTRRLYLDRLDVMEQQLLAAIEMARGETLAAARLAGEASRLEGGMPYSFGPPFVDWPAAEMLGELLLEGRRYAEAAEAFELQLRRTRQRSTALLGLARARQKLGQETESAYALATLATIWRRADSVVRAQAPGLP